MHLLTRSPDIRRCFCQNKLISTVITIVSPDMSNEAISHESLAVQGLELLKALAKEGGVAHKELLDGNFIEVALGLAIQQHSQTNDNAAQEDNAVQKAALEAILEFVKRSWPAAEQVPELDVFRSRRSDKSH